MKIAFDLDMTLNNMVYRWADWIRANIDRRFAMSQFRYYGCLVDTYGEVVDDFWRDPKCYDEIRPLPGAAKLITRLVEAGHDVRIVTHTPRGQKASIKDAWIEEHIHWRPLVIHAELKHVHTKDCVFVDDHPGHVQRHVRHNPGCKGFVFNHLGNYPWAHPLLPNVQEVNSYGDLLRRIL